ncbi:hypothetical protein I6F16_35800 [Bradyrhizobium sp. IC4060]|nr:hypothetical protein [Bradyrhizobium sp. IC4060]MCA1488597.1 hypothetical protein [Bradyrhizobium sp. IC4061]
MPFQPNLSRGAVRLRFSFTLVHIFVENEGPDLIGKARLCGFAPCRAAECLARPLRPTLINTHSRWAFITEDFLVFFTVEDFLRGVIISR